MFCFFITINSIISWCILPKDTRYSPNHSDDIKRALSTWVKSREFQKFTYIAIGAKQAIDQDFKMAEDSNFEQLC